MNGLNSFNLKSKLFLLLLPSILLLIFWMTFFFIEGESIQTGSGWIDTLIPLTIAGFALTSLFFFLICASFERPVQFLIQSIDKMGCGDFSDEMRTSEREDEIGALHNALKRTYQKLKHLVLEHENEFNGLSETARGVAGSMMEVTAGSTETASALTEISTTIDVLKDTSTGSNEKAKEVQISADGAIKTLKKSESSLDGTVSEMSQIQNKMKMISDSIIKLSEHMQVIGNIIDTVNDLAEQSNLLAVNAAIEAAKAGDQGKGFAVVAEEVRSLAEQSKQATIQVHSILNDIQNATGSAVMATEDGSNAVAKGVTQSTETSTMIRELSINIQNVVESAAEIASSSQQQLVGVEQVTTAMRNIKEASNQQASHLQEIQNAVDEVNNRGNAVKSFFKLVE